MSILNPKFKVSALEGVEFKDAPYDSSKKFAIYIPKEKDAIAEMLEKHDEKIRAKEQRHRDFQLERQRSREKLAMAKTRSMNTGASPTMSPDASPTRALHSARNASGKAIDLIEVSNFSSPQSKLRSKLTCNVELAKTYDTDDFNKRELKFDETAQKAVNFEGTAKETLFGESMNERMMQSDVMSLKSVKSAKSFKSGCSKISRRSFHSTATKFSQLRSSLYFDNRTQSVPKTALKNTVVEHIIEHEDIVMKHPTLYNSLMKLRDMDLLKTNSPKFHPFKGIGKINYVYNDFHSRNSNPGYSRNTGGNFYYR